MESRHNAVLPDHCLIAGAHYGLPQGSFCSWKSLWLSLLLSEKPPLHIFDASNEFLTGMTPLSLKSSTRVQGQGDKDPVYYRMTDSTHIGKVPIMWKTYWIPGKESTSPCRNQRKGSCCSMGNWVWGNVQGCNVSANHTRSWHKDVVTRCWCCCSWSHRN